MFDHLDRLVEQQGDDAQDDDACDYHVELEDLRAVNDEVAKSTPCGKKFTDDDAYQRKPDVHLRSAQQNRQGTGQDDLEKGILLSSAERVDKSDLLGIGSLTVE